MSPAADSPVHSSSSGSAIDIDDFAAFLDVELDSTSDVSPEEDEDEEEHGVGDDSGDEESDSCRNKRRKMEVVTDQHDSVSDSCKHPGAILGMCIRCGKKMEEDANGVSFSYIHKNLWLDNDEVERLRKKDLIKNSLPNKKLYLILDLDHTLLNSTRISDISAEEQYLIMDQGGDQALPVPVPDRDALRGSSIFRLDSICMMTKLRPFVHTFLKEASSLFEMYIYTMGERSYALEMAELLDPGGEYFNSKVISREDSTQRHQKDLDVVMGQDRAVLILDDTEGVWGRHKENLILMERYHFFASSCRQFGSKSKSLSQLKSDENEAEGVLSSILSVLRRVHSMFFNMECGQSLKDRDVRQVLKTVRKEVLSGCNIVFSRVFPCNFQAENHCLWKMAEQLGAICFKELDESVTHVVSLDAGTEKSRWAKREGKFLVLPRWIEAANYQWKKPHEEDFPVNYSAV